MSSFRCRLLSLPLLFLLLATLIYGAEQRKCYNLNGAELDSTYRPCNSDARHSGCCGSGDICLDNDLCMATHGEFMGSIWQNGCTDPTGKDPACPKLCPDVTTSFNDQQAVPAWNIQTCDYGSYCCRAVGDRNNCCNNAASPRIKTNAIGAFPKAVVAAFASSNSITTPPDSEPSSVYGTAVSTGSPFPQTTQTSATSAPHSRLACPKDKSVLVGGAIGGTLGATILVLIGVVLWMGKRERHQRRLKNHYEEQFGQNFAYKRTVVVESNAVDLPGLDDRGSVELFGKDGGEAEQNAGVDDYDGRTLRTKGSEATLWTLGRDGMEGRRQGG